MSNPEKSKKTTKRKPKISLELREGGDYQFFTKRAERLALRAIVEEGAADFILQRPNHPFFMRMLEYVTERAYGKVPQEVKNKVEVMPAVALPAKDPEQLPPADLPALPAPATALLPAKVDGPSNHMATPAGAADTVSSGE